MQPNYVVTDNFGNSGKSITFTQGETRQVTVNMLAPNGSPLVIPGTISTCVLKIFSEINQSSIQKSLADADVTLLSQAGENPGTIGFQFTLEPAETSQMAANNDGLPMLATFTDSSGNVTEANFLAIFAVDVPVVLT